MNGHGRTATLASGGLGFAIADAAQQIQWIDSVERATLEPLASVAQAGRKPAASPAKEVAAVAPASGTEGAGQEKEQGQDKSSFAARNQSRSRTPVDMAVRLKWRCDLASPGYVSVGACWDCNRKPSLSELGPGGPRREIP